MPKTLSSIHEEYPFIAKNIKHIRTAFAMSQTNFAKKISDKDRATIAYWENGDSPPNLLSVIKLLAWLKIDFDTFVHKDISAMKNFDVTAIANRIKGNAYIEMSKQFEGMESRLKVLEVKSEKYDMILANYIIVANKLAVLEQDLKKLLDERK